MAPVDAHADEMVANASIKTAREDNPERVTAHSFIGARRAKW
jgi:hypothetical protein